MKIGALIITTGLPQTSGIAALLPKVGNATVGNRLIASLQKAGVALIGLVTGPEQKQMEREFAQDGVIFLRCESENVTFFQGVKHGLNFMANKMDQVFVLPGDLSLVLPSTIEALLQKDGDVGIPVNRHVHGYPVLLSGKAAHALLAARTDSFETALHHCTMETRYVSVDDPGILLRSGDMTHRTNLIALQDKQLERAIVEINLVGADTMYDKRLSMLLHLIQDTQSVRLACSLMQMSYSCAWNLLNHVENTLGFPLVIRNRGGNSGNGSLLTPKGIALMEAYDKYQARMEQTAKELYQDFFGDLEIDE